MVLFCNDRISEEFRDNTLSPKNNKNDRQNELDVDIQPLRKLQTVTRVCFFKEVFPAPAELIGGTEQNIYERAERKNVVGDDEVFQIKDIGACTERSESGP